jgi:thiol-disulfide isomerase/thioredoxin/mono/diheme cytochrome c family protein
MFRRLAALAILLAAGLPASAADKDVPLGSRVAGLRFKDIRYVNRSLDDFGERKAVVLVFTSTSCPLAPRYFPTLKRLEKEYRDQGVQFVAVNAAADDTIVDVAAQAVEHEVEFPFVKDLDGACARALGVKRTPEVAVLDGKRRLCYRGRIDDQYRPGAARKEPTRHDLREALDDLLAGREVKVAQTAVDGCLISLPDDGKPDRAPTYAEDVAPLLKKHCQECHRPGTPAPFSLLTYEQAKGNAEALAEVVREGRMPPWFAAPAHGSFANRRGLSAAERATLAQWVRGGCPPGKIDPKAKPDPDAEKAPRWEIGEPDLVLTTRVFELPAEGDVAYQYALLPHVFLGETWVQSVQILPDNPRVVHHANLAFASLNEGFKESNFITGVVPGGEAMRLDDGVACRLPAGSALALQIHFVTTGKKEKCRLSVGLKFARGAVRRQLRHLYLVDKRFAIPPGAPAHPVRAALTLDRDAVLIGLFTHMHLRGKAMTFTAHRPEGKAETLLMIPNYRFDWQLAYHCEPGKVKLPKGTKVECVALYDNSPFNPFNPDPKATVRDGPQTYHEMMNGFVFYVDEKEDLNLTVDPKTGQARKEKGERDGGR